MKYKNVWALAAMIVALGLIIIIVYSIAIQLFSK